MKCTSAHLGQAFTKEKEAEVMSWWDQAIDAHNELGVKIHGSAVDAGYRPDDFGRFEDVLRLFQYRWLQDGSRQHRIRFHNHAFEFRKIGDQLIYDFLLDNVSPNHVFLKWMCIGYRKAVVIRLLT